MSGEISAPNVDKVLDFENIFAEEHSFYVPFITLELCEEFSST